MTGAPRWLACAGSAAILAATLAAILSAGPAEAAGPAPEAVSTSCIKASDWVGRYPAERSGAAGSFFDQACIRSALEAILPSGDRRHFATLQADLPIAMVDGLLVVSRCKPHDCPADHAMLVVDPDRNHVLVGFFTRSRSVSRTTWFAVGRDPTTLPDDVLARFRRNHEARP